MGLETRRLRRLSGRLTRTRQPVRLAAALMILLGVGAAAWLLVGAGGTEYERVFESAMADEDLIAARAALDVAGLDARVEQGWLLVPSSQLRSARRLLADEGLPANSTAGAFEALVADNDIWSTRSQHAKRWQAAKMAALSRLIASFPQVRSANVLFEPAQPRSLGTPAVDATAAVSIELKDGSEVTPELVQAVADLVSGSIPSLAAGDVRVIDCGGRSWRADETQNRPASLAELRILEQRYAEKIRAALRYIPDAVVAVNVRANEGAPQVTAALTVPRSYIERLVRDPLDADPFITDDRLDALGADHLERIRRTVAHTIGADSAEAVSVTWHPDPPRAATEAAAASPETPDTMPGWAAIAAGLSLLCVAGFLSRRQRRLARSETDVAESHDEDQPEGEPFAFLQSLDSEQLCEVLREEHPQAVALVLAHVPAGRAADVLAELPRSSQVQVVRRLAGVAEMDSQLITDVERALAERVHGLVAHRQPPAGGVARVAEILQQAGYNVERSVLDGLGAQSPELAESIRNHIFAFEDIERLPADELRLALSPLESDELAVALRTAGRKLQRKILASLPTSSVRALRREMEQIGPVRLSDVEAAQQRIVEAIRNARHGRYVARERRIQQELNT